MEKATPRPYWLNCLNFCEGIGRPGRKVKESAARMENIPSTMVLHKHVDGSDTTFLTMSGPLVNNPMEKWLGVIRKGSYQAAAKDRRWAYDKVSELYPDIDPDS